MNLDNINLGCWSAIGGAIVLAIIGFKWGGWVTVGTAQAMAEEMAVKAGVDRLTPICAAQFNQDSQKDQKLKNLKESDFWTRTSLSLRITLRRRDRTLDRRGFQQGGLYSLKS